jgi:hypothetical protein
LLSFATGRLFAKANIPAYSTKEAAVISLAANVSPVVYDEHIALSLLTPNRTYSYSDDRGSVSVFDVSPKRARPNRWKMFELERASDFLTLGAIPASGGLFEIIAKAVELNRIPGLQRAAVLVASAMTAASGGFVGYYSVYADTQDYDNPAFQQALRDAANWQPMFDSMQACGIRGDKGSRGSFTWNSGIRPLTMKLHTEGCDKLMKWLTAIPASWR